MQYINYEDARHSLRQIAGEYIQKHKITCSTVALECVKALDKLNKMDTVEVPAVVECERTCSVEPFLTRGMIGRDVYRCGTCSQVVGRRDRFCKFCGRKLVDKGTRSL